MRQERRVRGAGDRPRSARPAALPRATRRPPRGASVSRSPATTSAGARSSAPASRRSIAAQRARATAVERRRPTARRARTAACRSAASVARPSSLPCTCSVRKRCSVRRYATRSSSPNARSVSSRHRVRPVVARDERGVVATSTSRAIAIGARRAQRSATAPPSDQPSTASGAGSSRERAVERGDDRVERAAAATAAREWPWPGRSTTCTR